MTATGYSLSSYGRMITCEPRMAAYAEALHRSITPGALVIDLGAGPGILALLACRFGAGHVVAIEPDASIEVARKIAQDNGFDERITFVRDLSTRWQPKAKADVVVSDIRGVIPLFEHHISTIKDVRARLLKPGGVQIPGVDRVFAALVEAPTEHAKTTKPWLENSYGVDLSAGHAFVVNAWRRCYLPSEALLGDPQPFATLDYRTVEEVNHSARITFPVARPGTAHGIVMWFESELVSGVGFSNAPGAEEQIYGQAFFPLERPVDLAEGTVAEADISAHLINGQYVWSWAFRGTDTKEKAHAFRQSSFKAQIFSPGELVPQANTFCPPSRAEQTIDARVLAWFDGKTDLATLSTRLQSEFPEHFADTRAAFDRVAELSARYNKK